MLFDIVRNNKRVTQLFLALITLPFAFWGVESYVRNTDSDIAVASVGRGKISQQEFRAAMREQQDRMRTQLGGKVDPATFETPQMRRAVLDSLITQRLLAAHVRTGKMVVGDQQLVQFIASVPSLQDKGKFSKERYEALVTSQGMSKEMFEARVRQDIAVQQLVLPVTEAGIVGSVASNRWMATQLERREISELQLVPDNFTGKVSLGSDAVEKFYEANRKLFELPEQVRAEYLVLSRDAMAAQAAIGDEDIKAYYKTHEARFKEPESRRASHILIRADKAAPESEANAAKAKAEGLLAQVRKAPAEFAKLAKQHSQDPGSAAKDGDLDWFGRGAMVKAFEDAVFSLKDGQVSDVVRSDFGFHVIRVTGIRPERIKSLDDVKAEIVAELRREIGAKKYAEAAEAFGNTVYEQSDSLKPAAEKWKLEVRQTQWIAKGGKLAPNFDSPKLTGALFGDDALKNKRNTEAVEVAQGMLVAARVLEHKPAALQPIESVRAGIEKRLIREEAAALAIKEGEEKLVRLRKGETIDLKWPPSRVVSRNQAPGLPPESIRAIFATGTATPPVHVGVGYSGRGYALYRITSVKAGESSKDDPGSRALSQKYAGLIAEEEFAAWMASLKASNPVEINKAALETKER